MGKALDDFDARQAKLGTTVNTPLETALAAELRDKIELNRDYSRLVGRQGELLTKTVNALRGDPPPLVTWSHHDIPELAKSLRTRHDVALTVIVDNIMSDAKVENPEEHAQRLTDLLAAQFDSNLDYMGSEIIRRLQMTTHDLQDHPKGEKCLVCEDDDKQDGSGS